MRFTQRAGSRFSAPEPRQAWSTFLHGQFAIGLSLLLASNCLAQQVSLASSFPTQQATDVSPAAAIQLRFSDSVDPETLDAISLVETDRVNRPIAIRRSTDLTQAAVTLVPTEFLKSNHSYTVSMTEALLAQDGSVVEPFSFSFQTGSSDDGFDDGLLFAAETFDTTRSMTTVLFGPDRRVYAASAFGEIVVWPTNEQGRPGDRIVLAQDDDESRQYIDLEWDPQATAENLILWVSYADRLVPSTDPRHFFTGEIARLRIEGNSIVDQHVLVTGLPHGREVQGGHETLPHQPNGLCFHHHRLYQSVGSTSSSGGPANWGIPEQLLSACLLEIDYLEIGSETIDVHPEVFHIDPFAADSPVRIYATGIRNALEVIVHSNGSMYTAVNMNDRGRASDGVPDDPDIPGDQNQLVTQITPAHESLLILERDRHYGFPNPTIGHYVLNGGNPTAEIDPFEISDYPVGTEPESGFASELMFPIWEWGGTSPDGMIEYQPNVAHPLTGAILCCFYSANDIAAIHLGADRLPTRIAKLRGREGKLAFAGPLDITQDPATGNLYVADFGTQSKFGQDGQLVWLRPIAER